MPSLPALIASVLLVVVPWTVPLASNPGGTGVGSPPVVVVRTVGTLPPPLLDRLAALAGVTAVVAVDAETHRLTDTSAGVDWPEGFGVAVDLLGVDPTAYAPVVGDPPALAGMTDGQVVLGATAARLRGVTTGGWVHIDGVGRLEVVGVVADGLVDHATGVVTRSTLAGRTRYALAVHQPASPAPAAIAELVAPVPRTLARPVGSAPWTRGWRTVAPLTTLEAALGPLPYRPAAGRGIDTHGQTGIVRADVPILGAVTCHEAIIQPLRRALGRLVAEGLADLVDPADYAGCHSPRLMAAGGPLSRHAWGIAVDLNATTNAFGATPTMDPRVVAAFAAEGFVWGGDWPVPDGMHFEWRPA